MAKKVLLISTSAGTLGGRSTGLWISELAEPYYLFKGAGFEVQIASTAGGAVPIDAGSMGGDFFTAEAKQFMTDAEAFGALCHSAKVGDLSAESFDCVYLTGGHGCCVDFVGVQAAGLISMVEGAYATGKIVAADCHGPMGLLDCKKPDKTPLVAGHKVTSFTNAEEAAAGAADWVKSSSLLMEDKFKELGATFVGGPDWGSHVVVDGKLVTAQNPGSAVECAKKVIELLK